MNAMRAGILLLFLSGCASKKEIRSPPSYPVQLTQVEQKKVPIYIDALGHVDPIISIQLKSRIEGELTGVYFQQGREVKKDDLLFTIDPKPYEAILKQAQANLDESRANLILAEEKVKRYQLLARDEYYSQIDYETLQADYAAKLALMTAAEAEVDRARINLNYCWIYAPIDGMMSILEVDYGNLIGNNDEQPLATLNQMSPIFVTFSVPEIKLPDIQKYRRQNALQVLVAYEDFSGEIFEGQLEILNNQVDPKTGMIQLRAVFDNTQRELWPGQFVRTRLILYIQEDAIVIPYTAVQQTIHGPVAFVVKNDRSVERRPLRLGNRQDLSVIVLEGLQIGETIVLEGQLNLSDGAQVYEPRSP
jgi:multidrug efflux system membrane fusion protein